MMGAMSYLGAKDAGSRTSEGLQARRGLAISQGSEGHVSCALRGEHGRAALP